MDEANIDRNLICTCCHSPFHDPVYGSCRQTFCRSCIVKPTNAHKYVCPHCNKYLRTGELEKAPRSIRVMLDQLLVKCKICNQTRLLRGNFKDHIEKLCPKMIVSCSAEDIKCTWRGTRDTLQHHLHNCPYESTRPFVTPYITKISQLTDEIRELNTHRHHQENTIQTLEELNEQLISQIDDLNRRINSHQDTIERLEELNRKSTDEISKLNDHISDQQNRIEEFNEQLRIERDIAQEQIQQFNRQKAEHDARRRHTTEIRLVDIVHRLPCSGKPCSKCQKCRDWYKPNIFSSYRKRTDANCHFTEAHRHACLCSNNKHK